MKSLLTDLVIDLQIDFLADTLTDLLENIRESVNYGTDYVIVAGLNRDYAVCNADYVVKEMTFDPKCVICYDLLKNEYFEYVSNDPFSPKKLLEKKENQSEDH